MDNESVQALADHGRSCGSKEFILRHESTRTFERKRYVCKKCGENAVIEQIEKRKVA